VPEVGPLTGKSQAAALQGAMGRHSGYRRDYRLAQNGFSDRNGGVSTSGGGNGGSSDSSRGPPVENSTEDNGEFSGMLNTIEKRLSGMQQDFTHAIHKVSEKENEKFDLIFAILSELQQRQAHLEESVRSLKAQYPNGNNSTPQPQQQAPCGNGQYGQMNGQMGGQMNGNMVNGQMNQQPMQQFAGVMQPDGTVMQQQMIMQPQQMIIMQPQNPNGGMQYMQAPQMMQSQGAIVQQMPAPMAMQFIAQNCSEMGQNFAIQNVPDQCQDSGSSIQAQMDMIKPDNGAWQGDDCSTMDSRPVEAQGLNSSGAMSGAGSSEGSSQVVDDSNPGQMLQICEDGSMP